MDDTAILSAVSALGGVALGTGLQFWRDRVERQHAEKRELGLKDEQRDLSLRRLLEGQIAFGATVLARVQSSSMRDLNFFETHPANFSAKKAAARSSGHRDLRERAELHWQAVKLLIALEQEREIASEKASTDLEAQLRFKVQQATDAVAGAETLLLKAMESSLAWD
jgi:hypothetical protein